MSKCKERACTTVISWYDNCDPPITCGQTVLDISNGSVKQRTGAKTGINSAARASQSTRVSAATVGCHPVNNSLVTPAARIIWHTQSRQRTFYSNARPCMQTGRQADCHPVSKSHYTASPTRGIAIFKIVPFDWPAFEKFNCHFISIECPNSHPLAFTCTAIAACDWPVSFLEHIVAAAKNKQWLPHK